MDAKAEKITLFRYALVGPLVVESLPRGELTPPQFPQRFRGNRGCRTESVRQYPQPFYSFTECACQPVAFCSCWSVAPPGPFEEGQDLRLLGATLRIGWWLLRRGLLAVLAAPTFFLRAEGLFSSPEGGLSVAAVGAAPNGGIEALSVPGKVGSAMSP
jgi:hypothetical protein